MIPLSEKFSNLMLRTMLGIFSFLMVLGLLIGTLGKLESKSYIFALIVALCCFAALCRIAPRLLTRLSGNTSPNPVLLCLFLSVLCFGINYLWIFFIDIEPMVDFLTFYQTAEAIATGGAINRLYIGMFPHILGYSTFLGLLMRVFGVSVQVAEMFNLFLTTLSGICIYILCYRHLPRRKLFGAAFAYLLWIFCPSKLLYNAQVMSEPLYTCMIMLFLVLLSFICDDGFKPWLRAALLLPVAWLCGILLTVINATRPVALILIIAFFLWLFLLRGKTMCNRKNWVLISLFALVMLLSYSHSNTRWGNWVWWNVREETPKIPAYNIYVGINPHSMGSFNDGDMGMLMSYRYDEEKGSAVYAQEQMMEEVKLRLAAEDINFPKLFLVKLGKLIGNDEGGAYYCLLSIGDDLFPISSVLSNIWYYFVVMLSLVGAWAIMRQPQYSTLTLIPMYTIGLVLAHLIIEVSGRYKYSIIPMLVIIASFGLTFLARNRSAEKKRHIHSDVSFTLQRQVIIT